MLELVSAFALTSVLSFGGVSAKGTPTGNASGSGFCAAIDPPGNDPAIDPPGNNPAIDPPGNCPAIDPPGN